MNLDDILGSAHDDHLAVTTTLRERIAQQRERRRSASHDLITTLKEQIDDLTNQKNLLLPEGGMADLNRRERQILEQQIREKELSLAHEHIQVLRDHQQDFMYELHLIREELEEQQEHQGVTRAFYES